MIWMCNIWISVKARAVIIGGAGSGRTNVLHQVLNHLKGNKVWILDQEKRSSADFMNKEKYIYGADYDSIRSILQEIKRECENRKEDYEEEKLDNLTITLYDFLQTKEPLYVVIDIIQELYGLFRKEGTEGELDI